MQPDFTTIQTVKSISQRNLVLHWQSLPTTNDLPRFSDFAPSDRAHDPKQLTIWAIDGPADARSYRQLQASPFLTEAFGKVMLQSIPLSLLPIFKLGIDGCINNRAVTYMQISASDADGHPINCERLLLPFSESGREVTHVVASIQLISFTGTIDRDTVVARFADQAQVTLFTCIEPRRTVPRTAVTGAG
jgi:hypothetical protein